jgi:phosphoserine aminotransferase
VARKHNFCAGPAALPEAVLAQAQAELLDWGHAGASIMELSHRSPEFESVIQSAEASLRRLLSIGDDYAVLFLQGGASQQFAAIPQNLGSTGAAADYVVTGQWSKKAVAEGGRFIEAKVVASGAEDNFCRIPAVESWQVNSDAAYLHYCPNETIGGLEFSSVPNVPVPLVADMSSTLLSRPLDVTQFGVIYAGAQKNIGPAGLVVVIVRKDLLGAASDSCPATLSWTVAEESQSMYNTPPTFSIYLAGLVFQWLEDLGGLTAMAELNQRKASLLYTLIDQSPFYASPVELASRSWMNVPFTLADDTLDKVFLSEAEEAGLLNLKGHRSVGGMRASIYNAVPESSVHALCDFMRDFERRRG